jgi:CheY-like chemotaxis protein
MEPASLNQTDSGEEVIQYIRSKPSDLIVLDMIIAPGIDGLDTFKQINRLNPIVAKKSKKRSNKNLRKPVEYGLKRLSSKIIDHTQEATANKIQ